MRRDAARRYSAMPRLTKLSTDQPETRAEFETFLKERGNVPNMFRTAAHRPEIMRTMTAHFRAVMNTGSVEKKLKEMVAVRVSHLNRCEYGLDSHTALARRQGATETELKALETGELAAFPPRARVALEFAEAMTRDSTRVSDELFRRLREQFEEGEIVEIAAVAGLFSYFNRFNNALEMEPTR